MSYYLKKFAPFVLFFYFICTSTISTADSAELDLEIIEKVEEIIDKKWFYNLTKERKQKITEDIIYAIFKNLREGDIDGTDRNIDKYAEFFNEEETEKKDKFFSGFPGIGVTLSKPNKEHYPMITSVRSPASGILQVKDIIIAVNNIDLLNKNLAEIMPLLKFHNKEKIIFKIKRGDQILAKEVIAEKISRESVFVKIIDGIMVIKIAFFIENTYMDLLDLIKKNKEYFKQESKGNKIPIILDLRDNPGGYLDICCEIAELFLSKNKRIVSVIGKRQRLIHTYNSESENPILKNTIPIILINKNSASAAEVLAIALRENLENSKTEINSIIMGENSYGKISVQEMMKIPNGTIKLTTSKYYTPNGNNIENIGIKPDILIKDSYKSIKSFKKSYDRYEDIFADEEEKSVEDRILKGALQLAKDVKLTVEKKSSQEIFPVLLEN